MAMRRGLLRAGIVGALTGAHFAKMVDGQRLLLLFGLLMCCGASSCCNRARTRGLDNVRLDADSALQLTAASSARVLAVGLMSGFFGIGGGFLIVPGL